MSENQNNQYTFENEEYRKTYWHTCSHILAQAMKRLHLSGNEDAFAPKVLQYKAKKERQATQRQKQHLHDLLKYHKIELTVPIDSMSGNEISRVTDRIIFTHGRIPENERGRDKKPE